MGAANEGEQRSAGAYVCLAMDHADLLQNPPQLDSLSALTPSWGCFFRVERSNRGLEGPDSSTRDRFDGWVGVWKAKSDVSNPVSNYWGFNPRASNCRLHSAGASRNRSTPMPRGNRPSTAALTRSGARKASEIVMLT